MSKEQIENESVDKFLDREVEAQGGFLSEEYCQITDNLVHLYECFDDTEYYYLVLEVCHKKNLEDIVNEYGKLPKHVCVALLA